MRTAISKYLPGLAAACCIAAAGPCLGAGNYSGISEKILAAARANNINRLAVLEFAAKGGAALAEADYAAEKLGSFLAAGGGPALIERASLDKVLREEARAYAGAGPALGQESLSGLLSVDAVITGSVFAYGRKLIILARLIEIRTGRVLLSAEGEAERRLDLPVRALRAVNRDGLPVPPPGFPEGETARPARQELRDSPAEEGSCPRMRGELAKMNAELVSAKARYWADKMLAPGFDISRVTSNPGSEIRDAGVRARFYALLAMYYLGSGLPPESPETRAELLLLLDRESLYSERCGPR